MTRRPLLNLMVMVALAALSSDQWRGYIRPCRLCRSHPTLPSSVLGKKCGDYILWRRESCGGWVACQLLRSCPKWLPDLPLQLDASAIIEHQLHASSQHHESGGWTSPPHVGGTTMPMPHNIISLQPAQDPTTLSNEYFKCRGYVSHHRYSWWGGSTQIACGITTHQTIRRFEVAVQI